MASDSEGVEKCPQHALKNPSVLTGPKDGQPLLYPMCPTDKLLEQRKGNFLMHCL